MPCLGGAAAGKGTGGPGDLEVVAAAGPVGVDDLAGKEQTGPSLRLQSLRVDLVQRHAAAGDGGLFEGGQVANGQRHLLDQPHELATLVFAEVTCDDGQVRRDKLFEPDRQASREADTQQARQLASGIGRALPDEPLVHLGGVRGGIQVECDWDGLPPTADRIRDGPAQIKGDRAAEPLAGEHEGHVERFAAAVDPGGETHEGQGRALQVAGPAFLGDDGADSRARRRDRVAEGLGQPPAVAGRAGERPAFAAGGDDDGVGLEGLRSRRYAKAAAERLDPLDGAAIGEGDVGPTSGIDQDAQHIGCAVGNREKAAVLLGLEGKLTVEEESADLVGAELIEGRLEEAAEGFHRPHEVVDGSFMGEVAPSAAGLEQLAAGGGVLLQQDRSGTVTGVCNCRYQPRRPRANDTYRRCHAGIVNRRRNGEKKKGFVGVAETRESGPIQIGLSRKQTGLQLHITPEAAKEIMAFVLWFSNFCRPFRLPSLR